MRARDDYKGAMPALVRFLTCLLFAAAGCATAVTRPPAAVSAEASTALAEARRLLADGAEPDDPELRALLSRAHELEPDWIAPLRMSDDLALRQLRGPEILEGRREFLLEAPHDPMQQYLTGRLEGPLGTRRFEYAAAIDPASAWAHHGRAWTEAQRGNYETAVSLEREALRLARDPWEGAFFRVLLSSYLQQLRRYDEALAVMRDPAARAGLAPADRAWFELETAIAELSQTDSHEMRVGFRRGIELIRRADLPARDLERLTKELLGCLVANDVTARQLQLALAARPGEARERLRARLIVTRRGGELALAVGREWKDVEELQVSRLSLFYAERFAEALDSWLASCPPQVLDEDGLPRDKRLRFIVGEARALGDGALFVKEHTYHLAALGGALVEVGWFDEALAVADALAKHDLEQALHLNDRALAGTLCIDRISDHLTERESRIVPFTDPLSDEPPEQPTVTLGDDDQIRVEPDHDRIDRWLLGLAPMLAEAHVHLGGETDLELLREQLLSSPRIEYGPIGDLLHPGLRFSAADEAAGLGTEGAQVPGIAGELDRLGRFGIIGTLVGRGLDGMILRRLALEERSGEHLGVPWSGTIVWCEGLDTGGANGAASVRVSGAALHEGYWVDLEPVRAEHARWRELEQTLELPGAELRVERALETRGIPLRTSPMNPEARARERRSTQPSLSQSQRVRLAVLAERRAAGRPGVRLGELVECVAVHEEGHLCDRTRFLPLHRHLGEALFMLLDNGFSPAAIQARLEYRAQLTALCVLPEPRLAFVDVVQAAEVRDDGPLAHARAYRELLRDFLRVLDEERERDPERWSMLDGDRTLLHQLHRLGAEDVREIALRLARAEGL